MSKCEYDGIKRNHCELSMLLLSHGGSSELLEDPKTHTIYQVPYCCFCGADIRKPKSEPIIKRSGETFVCLFKGIDYLCNDPVSCNGKASSLEMEFEKMPQIWEKFSVNGKTHDKDGNIYLEITDEIAKLRPGVIFGKNRTKTRLYGCVKDIMFITGAGNFGWNYSDIRLATIEDLED